MPERKSTMETSQKITTLSLASGAPSPGEIRTPWVLFLEPGEALDRRQWEEMESFIEGRKPCCAECTVERHLDPQFLTSFAWVPTRHLFAECPPELRRYRTREVRLVHTSLLSLVEVHPQIGHPASLSLKAHPDCPVSSTALSISREPVTANGKAIERPEDFDLFCKGHQVYYDDTLYCQRFIWPHSVYHTIRFHHIPSIIEGLRLGLGNPEIAHFVLAYLIRFRDFETAWKFVQHLPDTWGDRHPMLHISAGTVHFARGDCDRAFKHFRRAVDLRPDSRLIVTNAIKMGILLDRYDDVEAMEEIYRSKSGEAIEDDFVAHFRRIHGPKPMKLATLSLCMIVRDEEENLARTLQSAREISDEMIVVDTGSSDRTVEIAEKAGARVYPFPWGNDFSAARNFAIEKATGDYILMLDGDEHFSPFFFIEAQTLKKLLPTDMACAFWFSIGYYYNESDWLFLLGEAGNFREESTAIRLFPRLPGIRYTGRISESVEPALRSKGVSIERIPEGSLHIIHEAKNRRERLRRKVHLYGEEKKPDLPMILDAVKDFSCLGNTEQAVYWLRRFYGMPDVDGETRRNMGLRLAGLLELMDREQADGIYEELLAQSDHDGNLMRAYAAFLIRNNCLEKIGGIPFEPKDASQEAQGAVRLEHNCYTALKYFACGEMETGFSVLESVLDEAAAHLFAQALRFYFLISLGRIDGAVYALDQLFELTSGPRGDRIEAIGDVLRLVTELSDTLLKAGHFRERALVLQGAMTLERVLVKS